MIVTCPTCGNSGDWCQACDGIGKIVAPEDMQPKPGKTAPGPTPTRRKK